MVHFRRLLGSTSGCLVFLWALLEAFLCPWTRKREARRVQKAISGQHESSDICMSFTVFSEVTDPKWPIGDALWPIMSTFDHMWMPLVPLFQIFEPNVT
jgi:hypothetical protein